MIDVRDNMMYNTYKHWFFIGVDSIGVIANCDSSSSDDEDNNAAEEVDALVWKVISSIY